MKERRGKVFTLRSQPLLRRTDISILESIILKRFRNLNIDVEQEVSLGNWPLSHMSTVKAYAIPEPLKVRMITKGESLTYYYSKFFQRDMWNFLSKYNCFTLTSEVLKIKHLKDLIGKEKLFESSYNIDLGFNFFVSGDYSAATDKISSLLTLKVFEQLLKKTDFTFEQKNILRSVLYHSRIKYPSEVINGKRVEECILQTNGQMMGSPLSFPILCTINFLTYAVAFFRYLKSEFSIEPSIACLELLTVLINGDDILFRANEKFYKIWLECIAESGFSLSVGKNYTHPNVLTINSEMYYYNGSDFERIPYLNVGLLIGQSKLKTRSPSELVPLSDWYNKVIQAPDPLLAHRYFFHYHKIRISQITVNGKYNLYLPRLFGGLGFHIPEGLHVTYTDFQAALVVYLFNKIDNFTGTVSEIKKNTFRPYNTEVLLHEPEIPDRRVFKTRLVPTEDLTFYHSIYGPSCSAQPSNVFNHFTWDATLEFYSRSVTFDPILTLKAVPSRFFDKFNLEFHYYSRLSHKIDIDKLDYSLIYIQEDPFEKGLAFNH
jgi:hypothetical protein